MFLITTIQNQQQKIIWVFSLGLLTLLVSFQIIQTAICQIMLIVNQVFVQLGIMMQELLVVIQLVQEVADNQLVEIMCKFITPTKNGMIIIIMKLGEPN